MPAEGNGLNELALFAGAGGGILGGVLSGFRTVCAVEVSAYCREVLLRRQRDGVLPVFPVWDDIRSFEGGPWSGIVDVVTAGFPCQPFSVAGKRKGKQDERNLWPECIRVLREVGPEYALLENVPALMSNDYFGEILGDLAEAGFDAEWGVVSAAEVGAPHRRKRLWIVAHAVGRELRVEPGRGGRESGQGQAESPDDSWWGAEPEVGRVAHGVAHRVDQLRALGNGQVARVAEEAWRRLK